MCACILVMAHFYIFAVGSSLYERFYSRRLTEEKMRIYNIPLADINVEGAIKPLHDNFGFKKGDLANTELAEAFFNN